MRDTSNNIIARILWWLLDFCFDPTGLQIVWMTGLRATIKPGVKSIHQITGTRSHYKIQQLRQTKHNKAKSIEEFLEFTSVLGNFWTVHSTVHDFTKFNSCYKVYLWLKGQVRGWIELEGLRFLKNSPIFFPNSRAFHVVKSCISNVWVIQGWLASDKESAI